MKDITLVNQTDGIQEGITFDEVIQVVIEGKEKQDSPFWIDFEGSTKEELERLAKHTSIHELTIEDILSSEVREKSEEFDDYLYVIGHGLNFDSGDDLLKTRNISLIVYPHYILSFHNHPIKSSQVVIKRLRREGKGKLPSEDWVLYGLLDALVDLYVEEVNHFVEKVDEIDHMVLAYNESEDILEKLAKARRRLSQFRRRLGPKKEFLQILSYRDLTLISDPTKLLIRDVYDHVIRMQELIDIVHDTLTTAQSNYIAQVSNRMNQVMKTLSIVATIMMPLGLLAGMFGMNVPVPGQGATDLTWFISLSVGMVIVSVIMILFFLRQRWL